MSGFGTSLLQAKGFWNIIRIPEIWKYIDVDGINWKGNTYSATMDFQDYYEQYEHFNSQNIGIEYGLTKSILRPYKYVKNTFKYNQSEEALENQNLSNIGSFINSYNGIGDFDGRIDEYKCPSWHMWSGNDTHPGYEYVKRICKVYDISNNLLFNCLSINLPNSLPVYNPVDSTRIFESNDIYVNQNDTIEFSFSIGPTSFPDPFVYYNFKIILTDGTNIYSLKEDKLWYSGDEEKWVVTHTSETLFPNFDNIKIQSNHIKINGKINLYLSLYNGGLTFYKDFNFKIIPFSSAAGEISGEYHSYTQKILEVNNKKENELDIASVKLNTVSGNLYLDSYHNEKRDTIDLFTYSDSVGFTWPLSKTLVFEELYLMYKSRYKLDGNFLSIYSGSDTNPISPLAVFIYHNMAELRFVVGSMSLDYYNNTAKFTGYGLADINDDFDTLYQESDYKFDYIYKNN